VKVHKERKRKKTTKYLLKECDSDSSGSLFNRHTSRPTKGDVFMEKAIFTVGSSTLIDGNGFPNALSAIVSPI
jgi:hypothetical protein